MKDLQDTNNRVAGEYSTRISGELQHKPFDRALLDRFAEAVRGTGRVCDLGWGPGHVARYLRDRDVDVIGMDLSSGMVEQARRTNPDFPFEVADMRTLQVEDGAWAGIAAFYSIIHIPREELAATMGEFHRVLRPGGRFLVALHLGQEVVHLDEWWGQPVSADFYFYTLKDVEQHLCAAGFTSESALERDPYPEVEHQSRRGYVLARRPLKVDNCPA